ncbi:hypothetical protein J8I87_41385 [Paraburkholderia sp. LEh10]|uniref:hypothetical protein n=1 Tax=Paraburkholderia sp. LEh10 TaxID=2821353 RepID=UPI001AE42490|nr:hypothetical protein [Paraburkholderia sp. LEh10]MBP0595964.1 hypothetical protein [Paraburkholderia sp. LEh10]
MLLEKYEAVLDDETLESVRHFIEHDEYEMAYEGLFIELMKVHFNPQDIDMEGCLRIGELLGLSRESIFDGDFWVHLKSYVESK